MQDYYQHKSLASLQLRPNVEWLECRLAPFATRLNQLCPRPVAASAKLGTHKDERSRENGAPRLAFSHPLTRRHLDSHILPIRTALAHFLSAFRWRSSVPESVNEWRPTPLGKPPASNASVRVIGTTVCVSQTASALQRRSLPVYSDRLSAAKRHFKDQEI